MSSKTQSISRFFQPRKGKERSSGNSQVSEFDGTGAKGPESILVVENCKGTIADPLEILDDSDGEEEPIVDNNEMRISNENGENSDEPGEDSADSRRYKDNEPGEDPADIQQEKYNETNKENPFATFARTSKSPLPEKRPQTSTGWKVSVAPKKQLPNKKPKTEYKFQPMASLPLEEQDRIKAKWQSLADPNESLEVRRFQVLVSARLHARCQEPSVRKAMKVLREAFPRLDAPTIARSDPEILATHITNLQFYNSKAKQIVKAAQQIENEFNGVVPEDEQTLLRITGVGKVFADLLSSVNTKEAYAIKTKPAA